MGFTIDPERARAFINATPRNREVLFPFLGGEDLGSRSDVSASRWIINFHDWPEGRARQYSDCYNIVRREVLPVRLKSSNRALREKWWLYERQRPELYKEMRDLSRVIVIIKHTKTVMPMLVSARRVFSHALGVFATDDTAMLALLSSAPHYWWTIGRASTLETRVRYTPSDVFETFALPELTHEMRELRDRLDKFRRELMLARQSGLTATYNLVNSNECNDTDIVKLREIHQAIDEAVCRAYGWDDLIPQLGHAVHPVGRDARFTIGPAVHREIVDRLLELNHERYAAEVAAGLHDKKGKTSRDKSSFYKGQSTARQPDVHPGQGMLGS